MPSGRAVRLLVITAAAVLGLRALSATQPGDTHYIGSTPCQDAVRQFVGGLPAAAPCHAITWRLSFVEAKRWTLAATYGVPAPANPNAMVDGPTVRLEGGLVQTPDGYRLERRGSRSLSFRRLSDGLIHVTSGGRLMVGTAGWNYTLSRADLAEQAVSPSTAPDLSYSISARASGSDVFGIFEGRTPCAGIATELGIAIAPGCMKVKWRVTLMQDPATRQPTTYKVESSLHRQHPREGSWRISGGSPASPGSVVYELAGTEREAAIRLMQGDAGVLFFLDQRGRMLIGNLDFSYTLNRHEP